MEAIVQQGHISSVNYESGSVRVVFADQMNTVSADLPMFNSEYKMPDIGDTVVCLFLSNNPTRGFCLGTPNQSPTVTGAGVFYKDFFGEAYIKYDSTAKTLTFSAEHVVINGTEVVT